MVTASPDQVPSTCHVLYTCYFIRKYHFPLFTFEEPEAERGDLSKATQHIGPIVKFVIVPLIAPFSTRLYWRRTKRAY